MLLSWDMKPDKPQQDPNQGEGDRIAAHHYNEQLRDFVAGGKVEPAARTAESYVERQPEDAARAERKAKRGPGAGWIAAAERVVDRLRARLGHK